MEDGTKYGTSVPAVELWVVIIMMSTQGASYNENNFSLSLRKVAVTATTVGILALCDARDVVMMTHLVKRITHEHW